MEFSKILEINPLCQINCITCKPSEVGDYFIYTMDGFIDMNVESFIYDKIWFYMKEKSFMASFISSDYLDIQVNTYIRLDDLYHKRISKFEVK